MTLLLDRPRLVRPGGATYTFPDGFMLRNLATATILQEYETPGQDGNAVDWDSSNLQQRRFDLPGALAADTGAALAAMLDELKKALRFDGWQQLYLRDDRYLWVASAQVQENYTDGTDLYCDLVVTFSAPPYSCGPSVAITQAFSLTPALIVLQNPGNMPCPFSLQIIGQTYNTAKLKNPRLESSGQIIQFIGLLGDGENLTADTGGPSAEVNTVNALSGMNIEFLTDGLTLPPGQSIWTLSDDAASGHHGQVTFTFTPRYL